MQSQETIQERLRGHEIQPSAQRVAVAEYVLQTSEHPSADQVWSAVRQRFPTISRATVYNTLNLFVDRGLLKSLRISKEHVVFDPNTHPHHHFIDTRSGAIHDVPWEALQIKSLEALPNVEVEEYQVVLRGHLKPPRP